MPQLELLENRLAPAGLNLISNWNGDGPYYGDLWADGHYAYEGHTRNQVGVDIIDISDPSNPVKVANFRGDHDHNLRDLFVTNGIGYFCSNATTNGGVYLVDLHDPTHPQELAFIPTAAGGVTDLHSISVDGNLLYETTGNSPDVAIFDVSNPASPVFVRKVTSPSGAQSHEVTVKNGRMYVALMNSIGYTDIYDVSNVTNTSVPLPLLGEFVTGAGTHTAWPTENGNYVYVTHEYPGGTISIFDTHNPASAFNVGNLPPLSLGDAESVHQVMVIGNLMYVSWYQAGISVYDVSSPIDPILVGNYDTYPAAPTGSFQGAWGVYGYFGPGEILGSDMSTGLYVLSVPTTSIQGQVFGDANGNGTMDGGEIGIAGRTVYLDANNNGVLDAGEQSTTTDANGNYSFANLPGAAYRVRQVLSAGWTQSTVNPSAITAAGGTSLAGVNFGAFQASITGTVFNDINGNGAADVGEPALAGALLYLDTNHDAKLDQATTTLSSTDTPVVMPDLGYGSSNITANGLVGQIAHVSVTINIAHTFDSDLSITLVGPEGQHIVLVNRRGGSGQNFTNTILDDLATTSISGGAAPFTGSFNPELPLSALNGANPNGAWTLLVEDMAPNDSGTIQNWSLAITTNEPTTFSNANGQYSFAGVPIGTYQVLAVTPSGSQQTTANPAPATVTASGTISQGGIFGFFQPAGVSGQVFGDANGNGQLDSGETGLAGRTVYLDANGNGVLDPGEIQTTTDSTGTYRFTGLPSGTYTIREVTPPGWLQSSADPPPITLNGTTISGINFGQFQSISLSGRSFLDANGNGSQDPGESGLAGWTTYIDANNNGGLDPGETSVTTAADGSFSFANLGPSVTGYTIREVLPAGWTITTATSYTIAATSGASANNLNFGNFQLISLMGTVFQDTNGNGAQDTGEPGLAGWTVFLDANNNGIKDPGELSTTTSANGSYTFANLGPGTYRVRQVVPSAWTQTTANPSAVTATSGINAASGNFGNFQLITISGQVYGDANSNGTKDGIEAGMAGVTVWIDANNNGVMDPGEARTVTDAGGNYSFTNRGPYTFTVRAIPPTGYLQTTVNPASFKAASGSNVGGVSFGLFQLGTISGNVFNDLNGNGTKDSGEPGMSGWTVFIDQNHDGVQDQATTTLSATDTPKAIPDLTAITSSQLVTGIAGPLANVNVTLNITHTFDSDLIINLISPSGTKILLINRRGGAGQNFTNTVLSSQATVPIASGVAPFTGSYLPEQSLSALNGQSANGVWTLQVTDAIRNNTGTLQGWSLTLTTNDPSTTTDASGNYSFKNLTLGSYMIREVVQSGWTQTSANLLTVAISTAGTVASGINFGDRNSAVRASAIPAITPRGTLTLAKTPSSSSATRNLASTHWITSAEIDRLFATWDWSI